MAKQPNFLLIDPEGKTALIPSSNEHMREIVRLVSRNVVEHPDKRELWQYISQYMKGVENNGNSAD